MKIMSVAKYGPDCIGVLCMCLGLGGGRNTDLFLLQCVFWLSYCTRKL